MIGSNNDNSNDDSETSDESFEAAFQRPSLNGKGGAGPPEELREAISSVHVILVCKGNT